MNRKFVFTGGPGAGKTTTLTALSKRGYSAVPESARRIIKERLAQGLSPRPEAAAFASEILSSDIEQYQSYGSTDEPVFYDRGIPDALYMLDAEAALPRNSASDYLGKYPYNRFVFFFPPWEDIYRTDSERDQTFQEAMDVFDAMKQWYQFWGYQALEVPRVGIEERVDFVLKTVDAVARTAT